MIEFAVLHFDGWNLMMYEDGNHKDHIEYETPQECMAITKILTEMYDSV